jgi:hypothetical protein
MNIKSVDTPSTCYVPVISKVERLLCAKSDHSKILLLENLRMIEIGRAHV